MSIARMSCLRWLVLSIGAFVVIAVGIRAFAQATPRINAGNIHITGVSEAGSTQITGVPEDWSSHHVVFSDPGAEETAIKAGRHEQWLKTVNDPRYLMQQLRRNSAVRGPLAGDAASMEHLKADFLHTLQLRNHGPIKPRRPVMNTTTALKNDWAVNLTTSTVLPNTFPAKYSFYPISTPSCVNDYVTYPTGATGSATAATIIAFDQLYYGDSPGCGTSGVPEVRWAYNTTIAGTAPGAVTTSPVLSKDGTMVAFVQSDDCAVSGCEANLIVLKTSPSPGTYSVDSPRTINPASSGMDCTAPCMTVTPLNAYTPNSDTFSSPYYDYTNDIIYVGDDWGYLYKITPVFKSTAANPPVATPVFAGYYDQLSSPVYDPVSGCVFVGDINGYLYSFNSGEPGSVCTSSNFSVNAYVVVGKYDEGIYDGVLLDSEAGVIYAFVSGASAGVTECPADEGYGAPANCVVQFPTSFGYGTSPSGAEPIGLLSYGTLIYSGSFDNVYYSSTDPTHPSGNIWVVGNVNDARDLGVGAANLYQVPIAANVLGTPVATTIGLLSQAALYFPNYATPVTENCNNGLTPCGASNGKTTPGTDTIYFSMNQGGAVGCNSTSNGLGCVLAYDVSNPATPALTGQLDYTFPGENTGNDYLGCWGTSAIIIDNDSPTTGASQVYYMYFGGNLPAFPASFLYPTYLECGTSAGGTAQAIQAAQSTL